MQPDSEWIIAIGLNALAIGHILGDYRGLLGFARLSAKP